MDTKTREDTALKTPGGGQIIDFPDPTPEHVKSVRKMLNLPPCAHVISCQSAGSSSLRTDCPHVRPCTVLRKKYLPLNKI